MQAPIQKIKNGRCRKTPKGLPMAERDKRLGLSGIKDSYHLNDGGPTASSQAQTSSPPWLSVRLRHALTGSHRFCRSAIQIDQRPMQIPVLHGALIDLDGGT